MSPGLISAIAAFAMVVALLAAGLRVARTARLLNEAVERVVDRDLADAFIFLDGRRLLRATAVLAIALAASPIHSIWAWRGA